MLPVVPLGKSQVTRLIIGGNPAWRIKLFNFSVRKLDFQKVS